MRERLSIVGEAGSQVWHHRAGRRMLYPHCHDELEVNLAVEGKAVYIIDGQRTELVPGDLLFLHPDEDHILVEESADFRMWLAVWSPQLVAAQVRAGLDRSTASKHPGSTQRRRVAPDAARRLARLFADIAVQDAARKIGATYLLWRCRDEFAAAADPGIALAHPASARASRMLREDPALRVSTIARQVGLTADHLARIFRRESGLGMAAYRSRLRLTRALELWDAGERDLLRLALATGFGSYSAFQRAFRQRFGKSPRDYLQIAAIDDQVARDRRR
ncbi:MAG: helix-turn-helix domain-containing protein [Planctomycetota bacterium]